MIPQEKLEDFLGALKEFERLTKFLWKLAVKKFSYVIHFFLWNIKNTLLCYVIYVHTVKPVLTTTFLKPPPVLNDHVVVPSLFRSNFSLYSDHPYNATNDHLNDVPGF